MMSLNMFKYSYPSLHTYLDLVLFNLWNCRVDGLLLVERLLHINDRIEFKHIYPFIINWISLGIRISGFANNIEFQSYLQSNLI